MIRFTWLQFRVQAVVAVAALAAIAVVLTVTGAHLAHLFGAFGLNVTCLTAPAGRHGSCQVPGGPAGAAFRTKTATYFTVARFLGYTVLAVPAITGVFWGAPLVTREFAAGTYRLAWTQSVTRTRWLAVKLGIAGLSSMAVAGLVSLMVTRWASLIDAVNGNRFTPEVFGARGIAPVSYAAFAFALGVTAGVLIRRTVPAMAVTLAIFAAVQVAMPLWVRPHLIPPVRAKLAVSSASLSYAGATGNGRLFVEGAPAYVPGAWIFSPLSCFDAASCRIITAAGRPADSLPARACGQLSPPAAAGRSPRSAPRPPGRPGRARGCQAYVDGLHLRQVVTYQPASRYWVFQWYETAIFTGLALALAGFCFWQVRHRFT
jgi:hypothetical protein